MAESELILGEDNTKYSKILVDVEKIANNFIEVLFFCNSDFDTDTKKSIIDRLPRIDGTVSGTTAVLTGGVKSLVDAFVRFFYKIFGIFVEKFLTLIVKPLKNLITNLLSNQYFPVPSPSLNYLPISDVIFQSSMMSNPATISFAVSSQIMMIKDQIIQVKDLISKVVTPIIKLLTDTQKYITELLVGDTFKNFNIPMPEIPLGIMGIKIPSIDMNSLLSSLDFKQFDFELSNERDKISNSMNINLSEGSLLDFKIPNLNSKDVDYNIKLDKFNKLKGIKYDFNIPTPTKFLSDFSVDIPELEFVDVLQKDPKLQMDFINCISAVGVIPIISPKAVMNTFYQEPYNYTPFPSIDDLNNPNKKSFPGYYSYTFDFFKNFPLYTKITPDKIQNIEIDGTKKEITIPGYTDRGLYDCLYDSGLLDDTNFIGKVLTFIRSYATNPNLPEIYKRRVDNYNYNNPIKLVFNDGKRTSNPSNLTLKKRDNIVREYANTSLSGISIIETDIPGRVYLTNGKGYLVTGRTINELKVLNIFDDIIFNYDFSNTKENLLIVLSRTFNYNFWNTRQMVDFYPTTGDKLKSCLYINGATSLPSNNPNRGAYAITKWNYKDFKLKFFNLIPTDRLQHFISHVDVNISNFEVIEEYKDGLTGSISDFLKNSQTRTNDRLIIGVLPFVFGCLKKKYPTNYNKSKSQWTRSDNIADIISRYYKKYDFKTRKFIETPLFGDMYNPITGLVDLSKMSKIPEIDIPDVPNIGINNIPKDLFKIKDDFTNAMDSKMGWITGLVDFLKSLFSFPVNYLMSYIEKFLSIVKYLLSFNVPKAVEEITNLLKSFVPTMPNVGKIIKDILGPNIKSFTKNMKSDYDRIFKDMKSRIRDLDIPEIDLDSLMNVIFNPTCGRAKPYISNFVTYYEMVPDPKDITCISNFTELKKLIDSAFPKIPGIGDVFGGIRSFLQWILCLIKSCTFLFIDMILPIANHIMTVIGKK